jgi:hypothetical protein
VAAFASSVQEGTAGESAADAGEHALGSAAAVPDIAAQAAPATPIRTQPPGSALTAPPPPAAGSHTVKRPSRPGITSRREGARRGASRAPDGKRAAMPLPASPQKAVKPGAQNAVTPGAGNAAGLPAAADTSTEQVWERTHLEQVMFRLAREHADAAAQCGRKNPPDRAGEQMHSMLAILMSYFALEAFINMVGGDRLGGRYRHYDRMSPEGKWVEVTRLVSKTGRTFSEDGPEIRALSMLRSWRNTLTHYKGEYEDVQRSGKSGETRIDALLSAENAGRAVESARLLYRSFYELDRRSPPRQFMWLDDRPHTPQASAGSPAVAVAGPASVSSGRVAHAAARPVPLHGAALKSAAATGPGISPVHGRAHAAASASSAGQAAVSSHEAGSGSLQSAAAAGAAPSDPVAVAQAASGGRRRRRGRRRQGSRQQQATGQHGTGQQGEGRETT